VRLVGKWIATIAVAYLTSIPGRRKPERLGSKSSASIFVMSKDGEKGNFSIATAVPRVIPSITKQVISNTGWLSLILDMSRLSEQFGLHWHRCQSVAQQE
jgi:hypothetical protein